MKKDFFISYNKADRGWAEWIAWHLEEAGYTTIVQSWDFLPGQNFVLGMHRAASDTERLIAVLSPDYLTSLFGAPEWASAFARDPTGEKGVLVPVRVRECNPEGLLPQIIYIDLVGVPDDQAPSVLLGGVAPGRRKPATRPAFPGSGSASPAAPPFPGPPPPAPGQRQTTLPRREGYLYLNVPPMPSHFIGRDALIAEMIDRLIGAEGTALAATGKGGVGKTTLAVAIAHDAEVIEHFTDGILWAGLGLKPDVPGILAGWGEALGVDVTRYAEPGERAQAVRNAIGLRRMLLVVDDAWQKEAALHLKCGGPNCRHLLTTRDEAIARAFAGARGAVRIRELEEATAVELLRRLAPEACEADPGAARRLARAVGGLLLALELVGAYLAAPERSLFPELTAEAFAELADPSLRLDLAQQRLGTVDGREVTLQEAIALSLDGLPEQAVRAFHALGAFAPKPETFDREAAQAVTESDAATLALLISRNLVEHDGGKLGVHQTVWDLAHETTPAGARERHARHYLERATAAGPEWRKIEEVYGQVKWAFETVEDDEIVLRFIEALGRYQQLRGLAGDSLRWKERGLEAAARRQDRKATATLLNNIGLVYNHLGRREKALEYYERSLQIRTETGDRAGEAIVLGNIGSIHDNLGRREKALEYYERSLALAREVGNRVGEAITLNNIGKVHDALGRREKALEYFELALPIQAEMGDRAHEAVTLNNIGTVHDDLGRMEKALEYYERALAIHTEVGDRAREAATLSNIGKIHDALGRREKALEYFERALLIQTEVGDRAGEAITLSNIGSLYANLDRLEKALEYHERSLALAREVGNREGEAITLNNIGSIHDLRGEREKALDHYEQALAIQAEVGDRAGEAITLGNIGWTYDNRGEREKALEYYERSLALRAEVGDRAGEAMTLGSIGSACCYLGRMDRALESYGRALAIQAELGDRAGEAATLGNLAWVYGVLGQREAAVEHYERALALAREVGDRAGEAATLTNLGWLHEGLGEWGKAIEHYERALAIRTELGDRPAEAALLGNIGSACCYVDRMEDALEYYGRALAIQEELGDRAGEALTLGNLGWVHNHLGRWDEALRSYERALALHAELADRVNAAITLGNLGAVCDNQGEGERAVEYHQRSLLLRAELGDHDGEAISRFSLAMVYRGQGRLEEAVGELRRLVELDERIQRPEIEHDRAALAQVEGEWRQEQEGGRE